MANTADPEFAAKEKIQYENNPVVFSSTPNPMTEPSENVISESSREAGIPLIAAPSASTSTSLTSIPPHLISDSPNITSTVRSKSASRDTSPYPRSRPSTPSRPSSSTSSTPTRSVPPRRSARTLGKGPERPRGPPELEAALTIAIRNLESDVYEWWCANQKPGSPIPTTAYLKGRSPRIRRAAEAVDEADRLLNEAVYGKPRKGRPSTKKAQGKSETRTPSGDVPETAFGQLELNSQANHPIQPTEETGSSPPGGSDGPPFRAHESAGD